jgi:hypothetical protein
VGIEVVDVAGTDVRILQRLAHGLHRPFQVGVDHVLHTCCREHVH